MVSPFLLSLTKQLPRSGRTVHGPARPSRRPPTPRLRGPPTPMVGNLLSRRLMMVRAARRARRGTLGWRWLRRRVGCRAANCGEYQQGSHGERYQLLLHVIHLLSHIGSGHRPVLAATQRRGRYTKADWGGRPTRGGQRNGPHGQRNPLRFGAGLLAVVPAWQQTPVLHSRAVPSTAQALIQRIRTTSPTPSYPYTSSWCTYGVRLVYAWCTAND